MVDVGTFRSIGGVWPCVSCFESLSAERTHLRTLGGEHAVRGGLPYRRSHNRLPTLQQPYRLVVVRCEPRTRSGLVFFRVRHPRATGGTRVSAGW